MSRTDDNEKRNEILLVSRYEKNILYSLKQFILNYFTSGAQRSFFFFFSFPTKQGLESFIDGL